MWIVQLALRRPFTVAALCFALMLLGVLAVKRMRVDILPTIDIPVAIVVWNYPGMPAEEVERRITLVAERGYSTTVDNIEHMESSSISGVSIIKVYFQEGSDIASAIAQISAQSQASLRFMPPGMQPPPVLQYNASNVAVAQLTLKSETQSQQALNDFGNNFLRLRLMAVPGVQLPPTYGGNPRQVSVDLDLGKLASKRLSPQDAVQAVLASNVILPAGNARIGTRQYDVLLNGAPASYDDFNAIPVKVIDGRTIHLGDVAHVHEGYGTIQSIVRVNGRRASYIAVLKKSNASTLAVVDATKDMIPALKSIAPEGVEITLDFDQSIFVRAAISSVLREAVIAAVLVALMVLAFLGSGKSVLIVCTSIPLAVTCSVIGLFLSGQTINLMTLGGLALSIGILVDDATVEVENIHRNRQHEEKLGVAILDSAKQVATPALATTLTVSIVFFPVVMLEGSARFLFAPLALSVVFAMFASYLLSRTLVPAMAHLLFRNEKQGHEREKKRSWWARANAWRDRAFERMEKRYESLLHLLIGHRIFAVIVLALVCVSAVIVYPAVGVDFFPQVDAGQMKLHFRAPAGTRIEETESLSGLVERRIRAIIPESEIDTVNITVGTGVALNLAWIQSDNVSGADADILVQLKKKHSDPKKYAERIRTDLADNFPGSTFYFQSSDVINQVLNFGLPAAIDIQIGARDAQSGYVFARKLLHEVRKIPGVVDARIPQVPDAPAVQVDIDRDRAAQVGLAQRDVAGNLLASLTGTSLVSPSFWVDPSNNVNYQVVLQTPIEQIGSLDDIAATPITASSGSLQTSSSNALMPLPNAPPPFAAQVVQPTTALNLGSLARMTPTAQRTLVNHYSSQPLVDVQLAVEGRDLGGVTRDVNALVARLDGKPKGAEIHVRGQSEQMFRSFSALGLGLLLAIVLVYLLLVILLQSWAEPLVVLVAVPGALTGVVWMLIVTGTTINVESLMGAVMVIGIAVSNSNLLVSFANDLRAEKDLDSTAGAIEAAKTRLRPVLMTALAMIIGMVPMALAMGEAGEQNAPLGRAVIGGLLFATVVTLLVVPVLYASFRKGPPAKQDLDRRMDEELGPRHPKGRGDAHEKEQHA